MPPIDQQAMLEAIASKQLGAAPVPAAPPPQPGAPPPQAPQQRQPSPEEAAATKAAPTTEADQMAKPAVVYEVEFSEQDKRKLTPEQIKSTFERYSALNHRNAQLAPVHNVLAKIMQENPGMDAQGLASKMEAIYKAQTSNPTMGQQAKQEAPSSAQGNQVQSNMDIEAQLAQWEKENAASLPPGYKDMISGTKGEMGQIKQALAQTQQMLAAVLGQSQGVADAARQGVQQSRQDGMAAVKQQIANNIDRAQQALQLPDDAANDFMTFSSERGYSLEDFADPMLVFRVMADFRNNMNSPEMERLKGIASRRQAYTGSLSAASPASGRPGQVASPTPFDQFADKIMSAKGLA
jgi:hypothetical protein